MSYVGFWNSIHMQRLKLIMEPWIVNITLPKIFLQINGNESWSSVAYQVYIFYWSLLTPWSPRLLHTCKDISAYIIVSIFYFPLYLYFVYSNERYHVRFTFVFLIYFTQYCVFHVHPFSYKYLKFILLHNWIVLNKE